LNILRFFIYLTFTNCTRPSWTPRITRVVPGTTYDTGEFPGNVTSVSARGTPVLYRLVYTTLPLLRQFAFRPSLYCTRCRGSRYARFDGLHRPRPFVLFSDNITDYFGSRERVVLKRVEFKFAYYRRKPERIHNVQRKPSSVSNGWHIIYVEQPRLFRFTCFSICIMEKNERQVKQARFQDYNVYRTQFSCVRTTKVRREHPNLPMSVFNIVSI